MTIIVPIPADAMPVPPSTNDPVDFDLRADTSWEAQRAMVPQVNALAAASYANALDAQGSAVASAASATASALSANASLWVSGATYGVGDKAISTINVVTYTRRVAGAGTTDPSLDPTNWSPTTASMLRRVRTVTTTSGLAPDVDVEDMICVTALATSLSLNAPVGTPVNGQKLMIRIKDNNTPRGLAYNAVYRDSLDLLKPTTTTTSRTLYLGFVYNSADAKWDLLALLNNFA